MVQRDYACVMKTKKISRLSLREVVYQLSPVVMLGVTLLFDIARLLLEMWHLLDTGARKAVALPARMTATSRE